MINFTPEELDARVKLKDKIIVVDVWASWCAPCKAFAPTFDKLEKFVGDEVVLGKLKCDDYLDELVKYSVLAVPTILYFKDGVHVKSTKADWTIILDTIKELK